VIIDLVSVNGLNYHTSQCMDATFPVETGFAIFFVFVLFFVTTVKELVHLKPFVRSAHRETSFFQYSQQFYIFVTIHF
jgi:hypothetical protein